MTRYKLNTDVMIDTEYIDLNRNPALVELISLSLLIPIEETVVKNGYIGKFNGYVTDDRPLFSKDKPPIEEKKCCDRCSKVNIESGRDELPEGKIWCIDCTCHKETLNPYDVRVEPITDKEEWEETLQVEVMEDYIRDAEMLPRSKEKTHCMREHFNKLKALIRTLLQKSHKDWLREEIERLEGMKKNFLEVDPDNIQDKEAYYRNLTLSDIQDHYQKELNQK